PPCACRAPLPVPSPFPATGTCRRCAFLLDPRAFQAMTLPGIACFFAVGACFWLSSRFRPCSRGLPMSQQRPAADIARLILDGFDDYRAHFREITNGARARFEQAQWQEVQRLSAARINLYEDKVAEVVERLRQAFSVELLLDIDLWPVVKSAYIGLIDLRNDDELAETWFNSIFCNLFSHDLISDGCMFIHTTRPSLRSHPGAAQTRSYQPAGALGETRQATFEDYRFDVPYEDLTRALARLEQQLRASLPDWTCKDPELRVELFSSVLYRNKGAYLVGRLYTRDEQWPLVIPLLHREGCGIQVDAVICDEAEVSIIFSFTRS